MVVFQSTKGKETVQRLEMYTSGLSVLPTAGGVMDQPYKLMEYFDEFLAGDVDGFNKSLKRH